MTPRDKVLAVLNDGHTDVVPFTVYRNLFPQCRAEREMRNRGLCLVERRPAVKTHRPNVKFKEEIYQEKGKTFRCRAYETPVGKLSTLHELAGFTSWCHEKMFKGPEDYKALLFLIQDEQYEPDYESFADAERTYDGDAIFRAGLKLEPLQELISGEMMAMQTFCFEWMDRRDEILGLYNALVEKRRQLYPLVAQSPATHTNYGGNVLPEITGVKDFETYYAPHYNEAAEIFHKHGKLLGCHFDANCRQLADAIARTDLDYVEAFTPAPDTDMSLADARRAWPDKVLWLNFPSSQHLRSDAEVEQVAVDLLDELDSINGLIMGVTEDIPEHRWRQSCQAIMNGLERHADENPHRYCSGSRGRS
jgi:hypothetical protein